MKAKPTYLELENRIKELEIDREDLLKSKEKAERHLNMSGCAFVSLDINGNIALINQKCLEILEYDKNDDVMGKNWFNTFIPSQINEKVKKAFIKVMKGDMNGVEHFENEIITKSGKRKLMSWNNSFIKEENGQIKYLLSSGIDITKRKKEEQILKDSYESWKSLFQDIPNVAVQGYDKNGKTIYWNKASEKLYGYSSEEAIGINLTDLIIPEELRNPVSNAIKEMIETKTPIPAGELKLKRKDGSSIFVFSSHSYVQVPGREPEMYCLDIDITERKQAEEEFISLNKELEKIKNNALEGEESYKALFESIGDAIYIQDYDAKFMTVNKGVVNMYGYSKEDFIGNTPLFLSADGMNDMAAVFECFDKVKQGSSQVFEFWGKRKNGEIFPKIVSQYKGTYFGQNVVITVARDISNQIKTQKELIKSKEKAEESDRLKSAFLANMSHEIRTPMNGIVGFTDLLQNPDLSESNHIKYVKIIKKSSDRLLNTVNDIVEISKIESGEVKISKSGIKIVSRLENLSTFFKPEIEKKELDFSIENEINESELILHTDKNKFDSILTNLIKNSIKYTNEGFIKVGLKLEEENLIFYCQDSGVGIPKNRHKAIFNRFEQADIEDKHAHQGSGLGLAIVKSYVKILGGKIWLKSEKNRGSIFYVSFPYKPTNTEDYNLPPKEKPSKPEKKNMNVLIVEDDEISSLHLSLITNEIVKNVSCVQNGIEAVEAIRNNSGIDLILMDMKMPKMGGCEATKKIREFNKDVIIVAQTAFAFDEDKQKALEAGCNDFISKPIEKDKLINIINRCF